MYIESKLDNPAMASYNILPLIATLLNYSLYSSTFLVANSPYVICSFIETDYIFDSSNFYINDSSFSGSYDCANFANNSSYNYPYFSFASAKDEIIWSFSISNVGFSTYTTNDNNCSSKPLLETAILTT